MPLNLVSITFCYVGPFLRIPCPYFSTIRILFPDHSKKTFPNENMIYGLYVTPSCIQIVPTIDYSFPLNRDFKHPFHNHYSDSCVGLPVPVYRPECMTSASAGYVYVIFENEKSVRALLQACKPRRDFNSFGGEYYFKLSSRKMRSKEVGPKTYCRR